MSLFSVGKIHESVLPPCDEKLNEVGQAVCTFKNFFVWYVLKVNKLNMNFSAFLV